jgi:hypothetical protein
MHRLAVAVLAAVVLSTGCSFGSGSTAGTTTTTHRDKPVPAPGECSPDDLEADDLEPVMVDEREGFEQQADDVGDTGPSDLAKAIRDDTGPDAEAALTEVGFRRGYQRFWSNRAEHGLVVFVYEFCEEAGAVSYRDRLLSTIPDLEPFEVVGIRGAKGISGIGDGVVAAFALATTGPTLVFTLANGKEGTVLLREVQDRATALLGDQLDGLAAD